MGMKDQAGIRMQHQEIAHLEELGKGAGFTKSELVRYVVRGCAVQVVLDAEDTG